MAELTTDPPDISPPPSPPSPAPDAPSSPDTKTTGGDSIVAPLLPGTPTDIFTGKPVDVAEISRAEFGFLQHKIGAEGAAEREFDRREDRYRNTQERLFQAEGHTLDDLKPWNEQTMAPPKTDLWSQFGSPGFILAMLASSFSAMPMNSALNGGAAAMNAINQGDDEAYHKAFDVWRTNTDLALKRMKVEQDLFDNVDRLRTTNMAEWREKMKMAAARFDDQKMMAMLEAGMDPDILHAQEAKAKAMLSIRDAQQGIEENDIQRMIVMKAITDENGKPRPEYVAHPELIAEVMGDAKRIMTAPRGAEDIAVNSAISTPNFRLKPHEEQEKIIAEAIRPIYEAKAAGRPMGLSQVEAQTVEKRAAELKAEAAAKGETLTDGQAQDQALEEIYKSRAAGKPMTASLLQSQAILGRAEEIEKDAATKGEEMPHWKALAQAQQEVRAKASGALEQTPDGDTKPPPNKSQVQWDMNADIFRATGHLPPLGLGGSNVKDGLYAHALFRESQAGGTVGTMQARWKTNDGLGKALMQAEVNNAAVEAFARNASLNSDVLVQLAQKVDKTGRPVIERWRRWSKGQYSGDADVTNFNAQVSIWRTEVAKLTTTQNLGGQVTVHAQEESTKYAGTDWGVDQIKGTVELFKGDGQRRKQSVEEEIAKLQAAIANSLDTMPGKDSPPAPATTAPNVIKYDSQGNRI